MTAVFPAHSLTYKATLVPFHSLHQHFIYNEKQHGTRPKVLLWKVLSAETGVRSLSTIFTLKYSWITATTTIYTLVPASASPGHAQRITMRWYLPRIKQRKKGRAKIKVKNRARCQKDGWDGGNKGHLRAVFSGQGDIKHNTYAACQCCPILSPHKTGKYQITQHEWLQPCCDLPGSLPAVKRMERAGTVTHR